jgi:cysteinyl-tRNA synthetase
MKIYNSLTRLKEDFAPLNNKTVNIYTCGVTVYDDCHIGHARSLYTFDTIRHYLEYRGYKVNLVRNITDIDDKIINRANELDINWEVLVDKYIKSYKEDLDALKIQQGKLDEDGEEPRATKNIPEIIEYISVLIEKGYAYPAGGDVYFEVRQFPDYGKLSGQDIDNMRDSLNAGGKDAKKDPLDFALWKKSKKGEPSWPSPWGTGRPGWHIECSVMSQKFLNTGTLDIHAGGRDLIFPHHENEIAQAEAYTGKPFTKYWVHHGLLTINSSKMSKSQGNFITIKDAIRKYPVDALKILFLQAHYSSPVDFSEKKIEEATAALKRFYIFFDKINRPRPHNKDVVTGVFKNAVDKLKQEFLESMDDDFNTPQGLARLFDIITIANAEYEQNIENAKYAGAAIEELSEILGLELKKKYEISQQLEVYVKDKLSQRESVRKNKDFRAADRIRDELYSKGIVIEDTKEGPIWRKL